MTKQVTNSFYWVAVGEPRPTCMTLSDSWFVLIKTGTRYKLVRKFNSFGENLLQFYLINDYVTFLQHLN